LICWVLLAASSCATLSPETKSRLHAEGALVFVRAPTPLVPVILEGPELDSFLAELLNKDDRGVSMNVTSAHGGPDPADLLAVATLDELQALGYPAPKIAPGLLLRFENTPERWPAEAHFDGDWLLHVQVDRLEVDHGGFPLEVTTSVTLFDREHVELHATCTARPLPADESRKRNHVWLSLMRRCAHQLLSGFK
jgi:hypothetical protein